MNIPLVNISSIRKDHLSKGKVKNFEKRSKNKHIVNIPKIFGILYNLLNCFFNKQIFICYEFLEFSKKFYEIPKIKVDKIPGTFEHLLKLKLSETMQKL